MDDYAHFFLGAPSARDLSLIPISISRLYRGIYKGKMPLAGGENAIFFRACGGQTVHFLKGKMPIAGGENAIFFAPAAETVHFKNGKMPLAGGKNAFFRACGGQKLIYKGIQQKCTIVYGKTRRRRENFGILRPPKCDF